MGKGKGAIPMDYVVRFEFGGLGWVVELGEVRRYLRWG